MVDSRKLLPRFERHIELNDVGLKGQLKLHSASVAIIGAGGLGCPASLYLCAAGIGKITLIDDDKIRLNNLQRQVLFETEDIGAIKVEVASARLKGVNPETNITAHNTRLNADNVHNLLQASSLILDCSDNFDTRYLLNEYCIDQKKTLVSGSVIYMSGQVYVFNGSPCYQCLYPVKPEASQAPTCTESAVLGPVPGVIGTLMATEAIKEIIGVKDSLAGHFLSYSARTSSFQKLKIEKGERCRVCS